jgi:large subunit ribosomal protein L10
MDRGQKHAFVTGMHERLRDAGIVLVGHNTGLTVAEISALRRQLRQAGGILKVTKNRLMTRALKGTRYQALAPLFRGPTTIAVADNPVAVAKIAIDYAKANARFVVLGGGLGDTILDADGIKALATLPSLEELRGRLIGMISTPAARLVGLLQAPGAQLARVLAAHAASADEAAGSEAA